MPGFGDDIWGEGPFGEWDWSRTVLYRQLPPPDLDADEVQGFILARFMEGLRPLMDLARHTIEDWLLQRDPLEARTYNTEERIIRLGRRVQNISGPEQQGTDGKCVTVGGFVAASARFSEDSLHKLLEIRGSAVPDNNRTFEIVGVLGPDTVLTVPPIKVDAGPFRWVLRSIEGSDQGIMTVEVVEGDLAGVSTAWALDDGAASYPIRARRRFRQTSTGARIIDFSSVLGQIGPTGRLLVEDGTFTPTDVGKPLFLGRAEDHAEPPKYAVRRVLSMTEVELMAIEGGAPLALDPDKGPFDVLMLPHGVLDLETEVIPVGVALQGDIDLEVIGIDLVRSERADFSTSAVIGRRIEIRGSQVGNDGIYVVTGVQVGNILKLAATLNTETNLVWYLRNATSIGDGGQVRLRAQSILQFAAQDMGLVLDTQESAERQRSWVANLPQWYDIKGTEKAYEILGTISGFDVNASQLWALDYAHALGIPPENLYEAGELGTAGRRGLDGSVTVDVLGGFIDSPSALFAPGDVGLFIRVSGAATPANNARYLVMEYISPTRVRVSNFTPVTATDANNGSLSWYLLRLYTDLPPRTPRMDDMNTDLLTEIVETESGNTLTFRMDQFCWEADHSTDVPLTITAVQFVSLNRWRLTVQSNTVNPFPDAPLVISTPGPWWILTDDAGTEHVIETRPTGGPVSYTCDVIASSAPALGDAVLRYECPINISCGFCAASAVLVKIGYGTIADESGLAIEKATERLIRRLNEVRPLHVRLIILLGSTLRASLAMSARIDTGTTTGAALYAPLTAYFDDVVLDDLVLDAHLLIARIIT